MGKKHKKHRPEWRKVEGDYEDKPLDKPLKLVLKVGGSEVTELSGSGHDSSYYDDRSDHEWERHKEKKKKKKKKSEKEKYVDDEDRRRRKEEKKKKREGEHPENECTPRQQLLEHFLRLLQRKDAHGFFAFPVTDAIAPGYSMIIKHPMDFSTMKDKIDANEYKTITEFKADFKLMCDNAMVYNRPETVYYKAAKKLLHTGFKMMSKRRVFAPSNHFLNFNPSRVGCPVSPILMACLRPPQEDDFHVCPFVSFLENECTPRQQLLEHFLRLLQRKDAHGFFAFPVTDAIAPGYSMIIKHPMDFSTMKDKIDANEYKTITEFKADFKLMCDNAMVYNRPETVYYKAAKKLLHTGFKMMSKERLLALKRSMTFMQDMDFSQQAAILGDDHITPEEPVTEILPIHTEYPKKSKKQPVKEPIISDLYELEGNACSSTDSTAEEHVLALVEHAADEARDRINSFMPNSKIGYLKKDSEGSLIYTVVNQDPEAEEEETHPIDLSTLANKLIPGLTSLGFKDDRRHKVTFLSSAYNAQTLQNNSVYPDLLPEEMDMLYSAYGDETGVQCALSLQEFVKGCGSFTKRLVGDLLDKMTAGDHSKAIIQIRQKRNLPIDDTKSSLCDMPGTDGSGMESGSVLDFMSMKSYPDMSLDMLNTLGKCVKKEPEHEDGHQHFDDAARLLQEFQDAAVDRVGSRPSSNLSSLSNTSERDHHHLVNCEGDDEEINRSANCIQEIQMINNRCFSREMTNLNCFGRHRRRTAPQSNGSRNELFAPPLHSRINGWSLPLHSLQLLAWLVYSFMAIVGFGIYVPLLPAPWRFAAYA
ncbi:bromodomain-containing protein 9-like, partial [Sinocyclocheilus grahami]|uniref:bromodomain-containing protein 9-like n=1 Tax=Sinocyclocheilus grahami TaxID=75366 RepID=UPI0007AD2C49